MNAPRLLQALRSPMITELYQQRVDQEAHNVVNQGIAVQASFNTVCAIEYMKSHNVDANVIERVLLHPEQRRKTCH
ncbi:hypothetical protein ACFDR9_002313 [Janthinobacterium sp. CG_23.3]|uniref:hypothetical protein n=1 Tax=unclassified Janthinobacterium TaxID=2610881 RepID=UPI001E63F489|nr:MULTISPECIES: hypothetical protein [unclassified Janthinobacterium]MEC5160546.1 hypothetical protein [Janthinobacterium sp. CG_S6]